MSERVFNITNWHGVNEAPEGEARLRLGEAAVMRNFCVTSGGALKKRPGSLNVAGLVTRYVAHVREGSRKLALTQRGLAEGLEMRPRILADDMGKVDPAGDPVTVTAETASQYRGYYFQTGGAAYELEECAVTPGEGTEAIAGGRATPGELAAIASGTERWTQSGGSVFEGAERLETFERGFIRGDEPGADGASTERLPPTGTEVGFETKDLGGYVMRGGTLHRYYGEKVEAYEPTYRWDKYNCTRTRTPYTYFSQGTYEWVLGPTDMSASNSGYTSYEFDSQTGEFTNAGSLKTVDPGGSGTLYHAEGTGLARWRITRVDSTHSNIDYYFRRSEKQTGYSTSYSRGSRVGEVEVREGDRPEADSGFQYVTTFSSGGQTYTVMLSGSTYYCYLKDQEAGVQSYLRRYSFQGYPLAVEPDTFEWYGKETYATAADPNDMAVRGLWSGYVGGREVLCAACSGTLWELSSSRKPGGSTDAPEVWTKLPCGEMDTSRDVYMFGFDEKLYILNGEKYLVWDGERLAEVEGYRPLVSVSVEPTGGGTLLENVNRLTAGKRCWFSPDGEATVFQLPEANIKSVDWVESRLDGVDLPAFAVDPEAGTVTFETPPEKGVSTLEIAWTGAESFRGQVCAMRFAELYNGAQDSRVFLYGDGTNRAIYSGLDHDGRPRADYFPDLYEVAVGDANTPLTAMIRHYNKLMAFKPDSAWSIGYDTITLIDGTVTAGFYVAPVNRSIGNCAWGQAQLVQNRPRTLDGRSVMEWKATSSSGITGDQRNAERVSQRVDSSIRQFDLTKARTFYDKFSHEYYVIGEDGTAIVQNLDVDAWYVYTGLDVTCMINYRDELYYGTRDGYLRHFSDKYFSDNGEAIDAYWESGAMSMGEDFRRKYSAMVWIGIRPEDNGYLEVTAQTDKKSEFAVYDVQSLNAAGVPEMDRIKLKAKKFTYYKLILRNDTADKTATVVSADIRVRGTGYVR